MTEQRSLTPIDADYEAIEAAVMETARGRWFLAEFARRNRTADTAMLLEAIGRLEQAVAGERGAQGLDRVRFDLLEMAKAIARTKAEIAAIRPHEQEPSQLVVASEALDGIVRHTERATSDILDAAENVQEAAWTLREDGANEGLCDELDRRATEIYTACSFQDLTAQRMAKVVQTLRYLEGRITAMIEIWGDAAPDGPAAEGSSGRVVAFPVVVVAEGPDLTQSDVDTFIVDAADAEEAFEDAPPQTVRLVPFVHPVPDAHPLIRPEDEIAAVDDGWFDVVETAAVAPAATLTAAKGLRTEAFADIDALDTREKLRRFT